MRPTDDTPNYNLKVVVQETGLKPDTLRAWERRYGMPSPQRTAGGHRLYSQRDIEALKWLVARQDEGLSISRAVEMWQRLLADGDDPLLVASNPAGGLAADSRAAADYRRLLDKATTDDTLTDLRQAWVAACLNFDEQEAERIAAQAFSIHSPEIVCFDLLQKGLSEIGENWYNNKITVQQEHFTSALALRRLYSLLAATPPPIRPGRILAGTPPSELHSFNLLLLTFLLRRQGWDVVYLGANVPVARMESTIETTRPTLVVLSAMQLHTAATTLEMGRYLLEQNIPLAYGGLIFNHVPEIRRYLPGHFLGNSLEHAPQIVEQLMAAPQMVAAELAAEPAYHDALNNFQEQQPLIEAAVANAMPGLPRNHLGIANLHLGQNIDAALTLGDLRFLDSDINWLQTLLANHQIPPAVLSHYFHIYHNAASLYLDERGWPILEWLARFNGRWSEQP